ncbi:MAG: 50S ribosomal protein L6 [Patescibacteria group bacterium]|jgi:large subunit ribosomal protein L6
MSRIGRKPIALPSGVTMTVADRVVTIKGSKGELTQELHRHVKVAQEDQQLIITVTNPDEKQDRALWGLTRALVQNMVTGVSDGFEKRLEVNGVGYKVLASGKKLTLNLGYSHPIVFMIPEKIEAVVDGNVIILKGADKQLIGETAAQIRRLRKPEPYKGKGIKYAEEIIRRKAGKVVKAAGGGS